MLEPQNRATLTEQLAPPSGFALSYAVGTTFTVDLATALSVPLSFASRHASSADDKLGVLDAVRRNANRIDIFAQAGEVAMGNPSDLVALLESMIHPVTVPRGLFHPKVWFLEYQSGERYAYRFLCASRNLTEDRSWDTLVRLDGGLADEKIESNAPLVNLLRTLPALAVQPVREHRCDRIAQLADRFHHVRWEHPADVRAVDFHVFGIAGSTLPKLSGIRSLVVSPFLSDDGLRMLRAGVRERTHLLSRAVSIDRLSPESLDGSLTTYVLDDAAIIDEEVPTVEDGANVTTNRDHLSGLHAKVVVVDRAEGAQVLIGSANATDAAWRSNVEVMVQLTGSVPRLGVEATLAALGDLKEEYLSKGGDEEPADERAQRRLEALVRRLAGVRFTARVLPGDPWSLRMWAEVSDEQLERIANEGVNLRWHLLTRADLGRAGIPTTEEDSPPIGPVPLTDITPFIVLVARDAEGNERRTIVLAELLDDVPSRTDAIIARQLTDRAAFLRLLALLLDLGGNAIIGANAGGGFGDWRSASSAEGSGLFEALVRAVGDGNHGLADARRIIDFVREHDDARELLPPGFDALWANIWQAHQSAQRSS